jgi:RNA polymerase sigma factor (sigma-70 family)
MPRGQMNCVLDYLRRVASLSADQRLADAQLLERYVTCHDEDAFATLVRRYGRLVRSVCWQVLHHEQDTDDAFQVTFLVFASKAASIRKTTSVASWLYGVAYRTAMNAKRARKSRREELGEPKGYAPEQPVTEAALREIQAILSDEVQRLPEIYRAPFILCCLEGKSRMEASMQLGLKEGTVSSRLAFARKKLHQRLARRGVILSATLCAVELSRSAATAGLSRVALNCTIRGALTFAKGKVVAADLISAEVAALAKGVLQSMSASTFKFATGVLLLIGCVTGAVVLTCQAFSGKSEEKRPPAPMVAQDKAPAGTTLGDKEEGVRDPTKEDEVVIISGRVLDPEGKPFEGAKLYLCRNLPDKKLNPTARATTGADGRFRLSTARSVYEWGATLVATSRGFGPEWTELRGLDTNSELTLRLAKDDVPITGRVLDLEGQPISGATVQALRCEATAVGKLDAWLEFLNRREKGMMIPPAGSMPNPEMPKVLWAEGFDSRVAATTDAKGAFRLDGFGRERVVYLNISGPGIEQRRVYVVTRPGPAPASAIAFHHATFDHLAGPSKPIVGIVREKATGTHLAGVLVELMGPGSAAATTDNEGRYRLDGVGKAKQYGFRASGNEHFQIDKRNIADTKGRDPLTVDFELERGLMFQGRLTDRASGKPVRAYVFYFALAENPHAKDYASLTSGSIYGAAVQADGSFRLLAIPGPGLICAVAADTDRYVQADLKDWDGFPIKVIPYPINPTGYHTVVRIEPSEKDPDSLRADIQFEAGKTLTGRIERPDGRPLPGHWRPGCLL